MAAVDRLSALPDSVLARLLSFLDLEDAVNTTKLSRRWRTLWREADGVNLDTSCCTGHGYDGVMRTSPGMDALLTAPALQRLEELRVVLRAEFCQRCDEYVLLPPSRLPGASLRVLVLKGCTLGPPGAAVFGRLETLRMVHCKASPESLQAMLAAAPNLAALWLEHVVFKSEEAGVCYAEMAKRRVLLRCPDATVSVTLMHCHRTDGVFLDAPGVRSLRYHGFLDYFPFMSTAPSRTPPANLQRMELSICEYRFSRLRLLRLEFQHIRDIAVEPEEEDMFLRAFPDLKFMELGGYYETNGFGTARAIANLLQCCPSMQELNLKFKLLHGAKQRIYWPEDLRTPQLDLERSIESLKRMKSKTLSSVGDDGAISDDDVELSPLKARTFGCLDRQLRNIRIEFEMERFNCFVVKLAKFLVENAVVLEEMEVHDGDQRVYDHIHHKLAGWRSNSSKCKIKIVGEHKIGASP
ncbi:hypothetical protein BS78_K172800 [Paspalum vaginatum]|uniref:F-box domain-containing protein n=1 Tax=Paspalum vaginatum TaxID=158149 RepID=A0A9W7XCB7_9POAL|nr:hypothetical protein BS78_K172800 [Paspalum vaginatum]